jgi:hypothetical protein
MDLLSKLPGVRGTCGKEGRRTTIQHLEQVGTTLSADARQPACLARVNISELARWQATDSIASPWWFEHAQSRGVRADLSLVKSDETLFLGPSNGTRRRSSWSLPSAERLALSCEAPSAARASSASMSEFGSGRLCAFSYHSSGTSGRGSGRMMPLTPNTVASVRANLSNESDRPQTVGISSWRVSVS